MIQGIQSQREHVLMKKELVERLQALAIIVGLLAYLVVSLFLLQRCR